MDIRQLDVLENKTLKFAIKIKNIKNVILENEEPDKIHKSIEDCKIEIEDIISTTYKIFDRAELEPIFEIICQVAGITKENMIINKNNRDKIYLFPRQVHLAILHATFKFTQEEAGRLYYGKDHATVINSIKSVNNLLDTDCAYRNKYKPVLKMAYEINPLTVKKLHIDYVIDDEKERDIRIFSKE